MFDPANGLKFVRKANPNQSKNLPEAHPHYPGIMYYPVPKVLSKIGCTAAGVRGVHKDSAGVNFYVQKLILAKILKGKKT